MRKTLSVFAALLPCLALASPAPAAGLPAFDRPGILSSVGQASDIAVV